jgi:hypothetical protein
VANNADNKSCKPSGIATPFGLAVAKYCLKLVWVEDKTISPKIFSGAQKYE